MSVDDFLKNSESQGKIQTLSLEESQLIDIEINEKMKKSLIESRYKRARSILDAQNIYITF
jgi:hypothetical protein